ncbi:helix-turn-helix transcriptional regulator [Streptomyces sp. NPDC050610]|uniref:helix-turn-helix transcriptional regulator n=1 Tax=Streptomyces sp. NPDC050610 TaxID=3157097 RepID=UPI00342DD644
MLDALGMTALSEKVYRGLLAHPDAAIAELSNILAVSEDDVHHGLMELSQLPLVREAAESPVGVQAINPQLGMEILLARQEADLASQQQRVQRGRAAAATLIAEYTHHAAGAPEPVAHLMHVESICDYLETLGDEVMEELLTFDPCQMEMPPGGHPLHSGRSKLFERGVKMRTICPDKIRDDREMVRCAGSLNQQGGLVRTIPHVPSFMVIYDLRVAIIAVDNADINSGAIVYRSPPLTSLLCTLFELEWRSASPLEGNPKSYLGELDRIQTETLHLLAQGHTDESVAKRLGVSLRTSRRIAAGLMSKLDGRSRFQAGVRAVQKGYLPSDI